MSSFLNFGNLLLHNSYILHKESQASGEIRGMSSNSDSTHDANCMTDKANFTGPTRCQLFEVGQVKKQIPQV